MAAATATASASSSSVVVAGATGAIGREFILQAVNDTFFSRVVALSRREIPEAQWGEVWPGLDLEKAKQKMQVYSVDWEGLCGDEQTAAQTRHAAEAFSNHNYAVNLLGSTRKDAGSAEAFHHYDYDFYEAFANAVKHFNPVAAVTAAAASSAEAVAASSSLSHFAQISSTGASASSWFLYPRTKGEADEMLMKKGYFSRASIFRPGLLGRKDKARSVESFAAWFVSPMPVERVAAAIIADFKKPSLAFGDEKSRKEVEAEVGTCRGASPATATRIFTNDGIKKLTPDFVLQSSSTSSSSGGSCTKADNTKEEKKSDL